MFRLDDTHLHIDRATPAKVVTSDDSPKPSALDPIRHPILLHPMDMMKAHFTKQVIPACHSKYSTASGPHCDEV
ncbi:hypothetical protein BLNAU_17813 [Blattamonas nauphoetae]|uniref:Uncharacterized protein n=1 Tax=Blattamonas nauphoetae TaxID=2049346 RepID=A0ABQ9X654_9EUKA|nr:hypothetical protein BLNAU_17813 [Blattamonas nauphoetae]